MSLRHVAFPFVKLSVLTVIAVAAVARLALADASCDTLAGPSSCGTHTGCTYKVTVTCGTLTCWVDYHVTCTNGGGVVFTCGKGISMLENEATEVCLTSCPCSCCVSPGGGVGWGRATGCNFNHSCN
jgi:hypothetical protein